MAKYEGKFTQIDPENCTIEELEKEVDRLDNLTGFFETKQLALKKFINSVYGATASKYFIAHNTAVAESITLQGQELNHFSENSVNTYFKKFFGIGDYVIYVNDQPWDSENIYYKKNKLGEWEEIGKISKEEQNANKWTYYIKTTFYTRLGITHEQAKSFKISQGKLTETKPLVGEQFSYLDGDESMTVAGDTDSVASDTKIYLDDISIDIESAFTKLKYENNDSILRVSDGSEVVPVHLHTTLAYNDNLKELIDAPINYIMRHKVSKSRFKIKTKSGKEVIVTGDHSCIVLRNNKLIEIKAKDINKNTDKLVTIK